MKRGKVAIFLVVFMMISILTVGIIINYYRESDNTNNKIVFDIESLSKFKSPFMGDASNTTQLFNNLMLAEYDRTYQIYPDELSVEVIFSTNVNKLEEYYFSKSLVYNSTVAFSLLENLQSIQYNFNNEVFDVTREISESWYEFDLIGLYENNDKMEKFILKMDSQDFIEKCVSDIKQ